MRLSHIDNSDLELLINQWVVCRNNELSYRILILHLQQKPGTFMEIGASDGEFRSLTLYVEQRLGFRGVLVEPHPELYRRLRAVGRSAYSINACATPDLGHRRVSQGSQEGESRATEG